MVLEIIGAILGVGGNVVKLVDHGFKLSAADTDIAAVAMLLSMISETAERVRHSRDQLVPYLAAHQKQHIQNILYQTDHLIHVARKALNRRGITAEGEDTMMGLSDRLLWVFKDKGTVMTYQTVLGGLHSVLLTIQIQLEFLSLRVDIKQGSPNPLAVICSGHSRLATVTIMAPHVTTNNVETPIVKDEDVCVLDAGVKVEENLESTDTEKAISKPEDTMPAATEIEIEFSYTTYLRKRYTERAMRESAAQLESELTSKSIEVESSNKTFSKKKCIERVMENTTGQLESHTMSKSFAAYLQRRYMEKLQGCADG
ncbi:hypothetical protein K440DRAFT_664978 [Wilcoxina mikolae CBS 423.85]|nr:hypothetical protein K440DRAFT_664978 [Wilcoxina mikolae CBS 423.85]